MIKFTVDVDQNVKIGRRAVTRPKSKYYFVVDYQLEIHLSWYYHHHHRHGLQSPQSIPSFEKWNHVASSNCERPVAYIYSAHGTRSRSRKLNSVFIINSLSNV